MRRASRPILVVSVANPRVLEMAQPPAVTLLMALYPAAEYDTVMNDSEDPEPG
jgi:hypothetical protein